MVLFRVENDKFLFFCIMRRAFSEQRERKTFTGESDKKFVVGEDPLEKEAKLDVIRPHGEDETKKMIRFINRMIKRGNLTADEKSAFRFHKVEIVTNQMKGLIHHEFMRDFQAWLLGRGKESDHRNTPWYRQSLAFDNEVSAYIDSFVTKRAEFQVKLELLRRRQPRGINEAYLFFKYGVRSEPADTTHFLDDWNLFLEEFRLAREAGQRERNLEPIKTGKDYNYDGQHNAHEMAPYGDGEAGRVEVGKKSHDVFVAKMLQRAAPGFKDDDMSDEKGDDSIDKDSSDESKSDPDTDNPLDDSDADSGGFFSADEESDPNDRPNGNDQSKKDDKPDSKPPSDPKDRPRGKDGRFKKKPVEIEVEAAKPKDDEIPPLKAMRSPSPRRKAEMEQISGMFQTMDDNMNRRLDAFERFMQFRDNDRESERAAEKLEDAQRRAAELKEKHEIEMLAGQGNKKTANALAAVQAEMTAVREGQQNLINYQHELNKEALKYQTERDDRIEKTLAELKNQINNIRVGVDSTAMDALRKEIQLMNGDLTRLIGGVRAGIQADVASSFARSIKAQTISINEQIRNAIAAMPVPNMELLDEKFRNGVATVKADLLAELANHGLKLDEAIKKFDQGQVNGISELKKENEKVILFATAEMGRLVDALKQGNLVDVTQMTQNVVSVIGGKLDSVRVGDVISAIKECESKLNKWQETFERLEESKLYEPPKALEDLKKVLETQNALVSRMEAAVNESNAKLVAQAGKLSELQVGLSATDAKIEALQTLPGEQAKSMLEFQLEMRNMLNADMIGANANFAIYQAQNEANLKALDQTMKISNQKLDEIDRRGMERAKVTRESLEKYVHGQFELFVQRVRNVPVPPPAVPPPVVPPLVVPPPVVAPSVVASVPPYVPLDEFVGMPPLDEMPEVVARPVVAQPVVAQPVSNMQQIKADALKIGQRIEELSQQISRSDNVFLLTEENARERKRYREDEVLVEFEKNQLHHMLEEMQREDEQQLEYAMLEAERLMNEATARQVEGKMTAEEIAFAQKLANQIEAARRLRGNRPNQGALKGMVTAEKNKTKLVKIKNAPGNSGGASTGPARSAKVSSRKGKEEEAEVAKPSAPKSRRVRIESSAAAEAVAQAVDPLPVPAAAPAPAPVQNPPQEDEPEKMEIDDTDVDREIRNMDQVVNQDVANLSDEERQGVAVFVDGMEERIIEMLKAHYGPDARLPENWRRSPDGPERVKKLLKQLKKDRRNRNIVDEDTE